MGLTSTAACASLLLAALLLSATLDCAREQDKHHRTQMQIGCDSNLAAALILELDIVADCYSVCFYSPFLIQCTLQQFSQQPCVSCSCKFYAQTAEQLQV